MTHNRIFVVIWLILSQLGGAVLALAPLLLAGVFSILEVISKMVKVPETFEFPS